MVQQGLHEPVPGGARFTYVLGSATLFLFIIQLVTGVWQMFYYAPTVDHAYSSVMYLRLHVPFGWLIHGLHYWGAQAFIVVMGLHVIRVFIWASYKKPRELTWLFGVGLLVTAAGLVFTGALLPWDTLGYWAAEVGTSIAGTVPLIGDFSQRMLRGGATMSQLTLGRFFVMHVVLLPFLLMLLIAGHIVAFRQQGSAGPWQEKKRRFSGNFWPDQLFKDVVVMAGLTILLVGLSAFVRAPITGQADPLNTSYAPKPEWNFLFLYQALKAFKGSWEPLGTVGLPTLILLGFVSLPFLDRRPERNPLKRPVVMSLGFLFVAGVLTLTILGAVSTPSAIPPAHASGLSSTGPTQGGGQGAATVPASEKNLIQQGRHQFVNQGCIACHAINGEGGAVGPDLALETQKGRSSAWLMAQLMDPRSHDPKGFMPSFAKVALAHRQALVAYLLSLKASPELIAKAQAANRPKLPLSGEQGPPGAASKMIGDARNGQVLFNQYCFDCHGRDAVGGVADPGSASGQVPALNHLGSPLYSPLPGVFAANLDQFIQHGSEPKGPAPKLQMPAFGDTQGLTQAQIANIEAYLLQINGVDRAQITDPGMDPRKFFVVTVVVLAGAVLLLYLGLGAVSRHPPE